MARSKSLAQIGTIADPSAVRRIRANLRATRLFSAWPDAVIERLTSTSEIRNFRDGQTVCRADEPIAGLFVILDGFVESSRTWANGKRIVFDYHMPGQILGIVPMVDDQTQVFEGIARGPASCVFVPGETFKAALRERPELMADVAQLLCRRMRVTWRSMESLVLNSLRARIAKLLIYFSRGLNDGHPDINPVKISQDTLAAMLGVSRQSINREIVPMVKAGILGRRYRGLEVMDLNRLFAVAEAEEKLNKEALDEFFERPRTLHRATD